MDPKIIKKIDQELEKIEDYATGGIRSLLLHLHKYEITKEEFLEGITYILSFSEEIDKITKAEEMKGNIKYTRTGYYKLNDGSKTSGYDGAIKADKHFINNIFSIEKVTETERLINYLFPHFLNKNGHRNKPFKLINTNCLLSRNSCRWEYETFKAYRTKPIFLKLLNKYF
jgi:hypothetical protein